MLAQSSTQDERNFFIITLAKNDYTSVAIHDLLCNAWGNVMTLRAVQKVVKQYKDGDRPDSSFGRATGSGRPTSVSRNDYVNAVRQLLDNDNTLSCRAIASLSDLNYRTVHRIITETLEKKSVYAKWVPHCLTSDNMSNRVIMCKEILKALRTRNIMKRLIVTDEKWVYSRAISHTSRAWIDPSGDRPTIARRTISDRKFMWLMASNFNNDTYFEVLSRGETVNA